MIVVQHPQRIQTGDLRDIALLPVNPPEINAFIFFWMKYTFEICFQEFAACDVKIDGSFVFGIYISQFLRHSRICFLEGADSTSRMKVYRDFHSMVMKPVHKTLRIRIVLFVPGISGPAAAIFWIHFLYQMPVHVQNTNRKWDFLFLKAGYKCLVAVFCVSVITAPPVSKGISWEHRRFSGETVKIIQSFFVIISISENINVHPISCAHLSPSVFIQHQRMAVINLRAATSGHNSLLERAFPIYLVQGSCSSAKIVTFFPIIPYCTIGVLTAYCV